jgi:Transposase DDE domain
VPTKFVDFFPTAGAYAGKMYLRHTTRMKDGKAHTYWRLVRSVRVGRKVIQQTVAHLGELDAEGRARAKALARAITGEREQTDLFTPVEPPAVPVRVRLDRIHVERGRTFGDVWLGWTLWRALRLDEVCERLLPTGRAEVPWATMAAVLVLARLCEPSSELHIAEDWYRRTALDDLLALPAPLVNDDRCYRALDQLLPHKTALEQHLVARLGELFALDYDLLLYDVTSTYFEGQAARNPLARRGHSRDHRPDCPQVCVALVVTREGLPLGYELFAGNRTDVTTVREIVEIMETRYGAAQRIWVMDRGMTSAKNLAWLRETGRRYLVGTPKSELKKWAGPLADARDWQLVREGLEAKQCAGPEGVETFVLIRSVERREKERAMHERLTKRIETGLERLGRRVRQARRLLDVRRLERQLGRLLERNQPAAGRYVIEFIPDATLHAGVRLDWRVQPDWDDCAGARAATCCVRTSTTGAPTTSGARTSSSPTPKPPFGFRRANSASGRCGINAPIGSRRTFSCVSSPTCCGRRSSSGNGAQAWTRARAPSSTNRNGFRAPTSCCRPTTAGSCACAASCARTSRRRPCLTGLGSTSPSACGSAHRSSNTRRCSADFVAKGPSQNKCTRLWDHGW